ncbi:MAG: hypothetical protein ABI361_14245 [Nitrososphaera sp.]
MQGEEPFSIDELLSFLDSLGTDCTAFRKARPLMNEQELRHGLMQLFRAHIIYRAYYESRNVCHWCCIDYPAFTRRCLRCDSTLPQVQHIYRQKRRASRRDSARNAK